MPNKTLNQTNDPQSYKIRSANLIKNKHSTEQKDDVLNVTSSYKNLSALGSPCINNCEKLLTRITKNRKSFSASPTKNIRKTTTIKDISTHDESDVVSNVMNESQSPNVFEHVITPEEGKHIKNILSKHFLFQDTTDDVMQSIFNELIYFTFEKDKIIYSQGDEGNFFYILAEGEVKAVTTCEDGTTKEKKYSKWDCFGELSLMSQCKREETLTSITNISVFSLDGESFRDIQKRHAEIRFRDRYNFLNTISIFQPLENISKHNVADKLVIREFFPNEKIISYGTVGETLYIIKNGLVSCRIGMKEIRKLGNNDYFGQNAILIDMKRSCDVIALNHTSCYEIDRKALKDALGPSYIDVILFSFFKNCIDNNKFFKEIFTAEKIENCFKNFKIVRYPYKEKIASSSSLGNKRVIMIIDGSIYKEKDGGYELFARKGDVLGEEFFQNSSSEIPNDLLAYPDCIAFEASVIDICKSLNITLNTLSASVINNNEEKLPLKLLNQIAKLKNFFLFKNLSEKTLEIIAKKMKKKNYKKGDEIIKEGTNGDCFYLINKGKVRITVNGKMLRDLESGNCFGELALLNEGKEGVKRTATVSALDEKVVCYEISKEDFDALFQDNNIKEYMKKKIALQDTSIELKDLHFIKFLGKGKFGNVNLVHNCKNIYAIKAVSRRAVDKQKILAKYFVNERRVMLTLDHPFIIKMVKTLKNKLFCFFLMEYVDGKNLDEYLSRCVVKKNEEETRFYISQILLMVDYLQSKQIAHRDIKPSNIMIESNGFLKMIDFGTAKILTDYTNTVIGTPHYISPEILQGKGYSLSCDFWSVGVCMFEIFYGIYPFGNYANEVLEIYKEIVHKELCFPSENPAYNKVNALIKDLLRKRVNQRVCSLSVLKKRPFFDGFEWDKLVDFQLKPPYIPGNRDLSDEMNIRNPFENMINDDSFCTIKGQGEVPPNYNKKWADEF